MIRISPVSHCRLSGEPLADAAVLLDLPECPFPGIYPASAEESRRLKSPLRVVQAKTSGLVQLAHSVDASAYRDYAFAGGFSAGYSRHLAGFAKRIAARFPKDARILEIGCGDGTLLKILKEDGFSSVFGIDPGLPAAALVGTLRVASGFFPADMPADWLAAGFDLVVFRHVLEHIETPLAFLKSVAENLRPGGEVWIEVPSLEATARNKIWSNFYAIHCNYFDASTLDSMAAEAGLGCVGAQEVPVFGGSWLRNYRMGVEPSARTRMAWPDFRDGVAQWRDAMANLADRMPADTAGYGAGERTATMMGFAPPLAGKIRRIYDANPLLDRRFLGGTGIPICSRDHLAEDRPEGVLVFALSNSKEIVDGLKRQLPASTLVGIASDPPVFGRLDAIKLPS